jgi:3'-phosphoadenosine 5'-phosphosulfate sulfotransferase (PAPS reductase)/FAD synthetase
MSEKDKLAMTVDRMKTETIHAQAMQLEFMRRRLDDAEQKNLELTKENRTLMLKLAAANRALEKAIGQVTGGHGGLATPSTN